MTGVITDPHRRFSSPAQALKCALLFLALLSSRAAFADPVQAVLEYFPLSRQERAEIDRLACRPRMSKVHLAVGIGAKGLGREEFNATVRCAPHAKIFGNPVYFELWCGFKGSFQCREEREILSARFRDRRVLVSAKGTTLTEAYRVVSHLVVRVAIPPAHIIDTYEQQGSLPLDECEVRAVNENTFHVECQSEERRVERTGAPGSVTYRQVPLPWCATSDNPACVYVP